MLRAGPGTGPRWTAANGGADTVLTTTRPAAAKGIIPVVKGRPVTVVRLILAPISAGLTGS